MWRTTFLATIALFCLGTHAQAGGPPPLFVVVEKVVLEPNENAPERIQIWGSFVRTDGKIEGKFGAPVHGYMHLSIVSGREQQCREEWARWRKAAGTGKAVAVGCCWEGENFLKLPIHKASDAVQAPDGTYSTGLIGLFGDLYAKGQFDDLAHVKGLIEFTKRRQANAEPGPNTPRVPPNKK